LGSEYLFVCLGEHMLGVYSLSTGQLVSEITPSAGHLTSKQCCLLCLEVFDKVGQGAAFNDALCDKSSMLAITFCLPKSCVHIFKVSMNYESSAAVGNVPAHRKYEQMSMTGIFFGFALSIVTRMLQYCCAKYIYIVYIICLYYYKHIYTHRQLCIHVMYTLGDRSIGV
jgi:hypothetical protein